MNQRKEEDTTEADFIIRSYTKAELAQLYCPGLDPVLALQKLYRWMRKNTALTQALSDVNYNKYRHSFLNREVRLVCVLPGRTIESPQRDTESHRVFFLKAYQMKI